MYVLMVGSEGGQMFRLTPKPLTLSAVKDKAKKILNQQREHCERYDRDALGPLLHAAEGINGLTPDAFKAGAPLGWSVPIYPLPKPWRIEIHPRWN